MNDNKNKIELDTCNNSKKYKIETIQNGTVYVNKSAKNYLSKFSNFLF